MNFYLKWHRNHEWSKLEFSNSLNKKHAFNFIPVSVEIEVKTLPHMKATITAKVEPEGLECGGIFISY